MTYALVSWQITQPLSFGALRNGPVFQLLLQHKWSHSCWHSEGLFIPGGWNP